MENSWSLYKNGWIYRYHWDRMHRSYLHCTRPPCMHLVTNFNYAVFMSMRFETSYFFHSNIHNISCIIQSSTDAHDYNQYSHTVYRTPRGFADCCGIAHGYINRVRWWKHHNDYLKWNMFNALGIRPQYLWKNCLRS